MKPVHRRAWLWTAGALILMLAACGDGEEKKFVSSCTAKGLGDETQCKCVYEVARDALNDEQMPLFTAMALEDQAEVARLQAGLGIMSGATTLARIGWVTANLGEACGV